MIVFVIPPCIFLKSLCGVASMGAVMPSPLFPRGVPVFYSFFFVIVSAGFPFFSNILLAILSSFFSMVMFPLAACIIYSGICFTMSSYSLRRVSMLIWVCFLHLLIVAGPFHPHSSRLSWICAWTSSFVHMEFRPFLRCLLLC